MDVQTDMASFGLQPGRYPASKPTARYLDPILERDRRPGQPWPRFNAMRQRFGCWTRAVVSPKAAVALFRVTASRTRTFKIGILKRHVAHHADIVRQFRLICRWPDPASARTNMINRMMMISAGFTCCRYKSNVSLTLSVVSQNFNPGFQLCSLFSTWCRISVLCCCRYDYHILIV